MSTKGELMLAWLCFLAYVAAAVAAVWSGSREESIFKPFTVAAALIAIGTAWVLVAPDLGQMALAGLVVPASCVFAYFSGRGCT